MHLNVWCGTSQASQSETFPVSLLSSDGMEKNDDDNASASRHVGRRAGDLIYNVKRTRNTVVYCPLSALVSVRCLATRLSSYTKLCTKYSTVHISVQDSVQSSSRILTDHLHIRLSHSLAWQHHVERQMKHNQQSHSRC